MAETHVFSGLGRCVLFFSFSISGVLFSGEPAVRFPEVSTIWFFIVFNDGDFPCENPATFDDGILQPFAAMPGRRTNVVRQWTPWRSCWSTITLHWQLCLTRRQTTAWCNITSNRDFEPNLTLGSSVKIRFVCFSHPEDRGIWWRWTHFDKYQYICLKCVVQPPTSDTVDCCCSFCSKVCPFLSGFWLNIDDSELKMMVSPRRSSHPEYLIRRPIGSMYGLYTQIFTFILMPFLWLELCKHQAKHIKIRFAYVVDYNDNQPVFMHVLTMG